VSEPGNGPGKRHRGGPSDQPMRLGEVGRWQRRRARERGAAAASEKRRGKG